jgi:hypothetical protein
MQTISRTMTADASTIIHRTNKCILFIVTLNESMEEETMMPLEG